MEDFIQEFVVPFWDVIPAKDNPQRDDLERRERLGIEILIPKSAANSSYASEDDC